MIDDKDRRQMEKELEMAEEARTRWMEGRARVCARRAAVVALRAYLEDRDLSYDQSSLTHLAETVIHQEDVDAKIRTVAEHLVIKVDQDFNFSPEIDLIAEVRWLIQTLDNKGMKT